MAQAKKIAYIYTANHAIEHGITDIVEILSKTLSRHQIELERSEEIKENSINFIIDEFCDQDSRQVVADWKEQNKRGKLILVHTEFITKKNFFISFNLFNTQFETLLIQVALILFCFRFKDYSFLPRLITPCLFFRLLFLFPLSVTLLFKKRRLVVRDIVRKSAYNFLRYAGLISVARKFDHVICFHKSQTVQSYVVFGSDAIVLHPELSEFEIAATTNNMLERKRAEVKCTGFQTNYRTAILQTLDQLSKFYGQSKYFRITTDVSFVVSPKQKTTNTIPVQIPQCELWPNSSPTRIWRSIMKNHQLPFSTKVFSQHPIENLCCHIHLDHNFVEDLSKYWSQENVKDRLKSYDKIAKNFNNSLIQLII